MLSKEKETLARALTKKYEQNVLRIKHLEDLVETKYPCTSLLSELEVDSVGYRFCKFSLILLKSPNVSDSFIKEGEQVTIAVALADSEEELIDALTNYEKYLQKVLER